MVAPKSQFRQHLVGDLRPDSQHDASSRYIRKSHKIDYGTEGYDCMCRDQTKLL